MTGQFHPLTPFSGSHVPPTWGHATPPHKHRGLKPEPPSPAVADPDEAVVPDVDLRLHDRVITERISAKSLHDRKRRCRRPVRVRLGLRWRDIDYTNRRVWVRRSIGLGGVVKQPKTARSVRAIALPRMVADEPEEHWKTSPKFRASDDYVFASSTGTPLDGRNMIREVFEPARKAAKLPPLRFHRPTQLRERPDRAGGASEDDL
jgi:hypothetical protein